MKARLSNFTPDLYLHKIVCSAIIIQHIYLLTEMHKKAISVCNANLCNFTEKFLDNNSPCPNFSLTRTLLLTSIIPMISMASINIQDDISMQVTCSAIGLSHKTCFLKYLMKCRSYDISISFEMNVTLKTETCKTKHIPKLG